MHCEPHSDHFKVLQLKDKILEASYLTGPGGQRVAEDWCEVLSLACPTQETGLMN